MNYTTITIENQQIGLKFGMYSARYLADKLTNGFCFVKDEITEIGIAHLVYAGYINNCAIKDEKPQITFEQVVDFVEGSVNDPEKVNNLANVVKVWADLQLKNVDGNNTGKKKRVLKK